MVDYGKRLLIAAAIALFLGILFMGASTSFASTTVDDELLQSMIWPTTGDVTDTYGTRGGSHYGIDIGAPEGTPVYSIESGVVSRSYYSDTYGNVIFIEHPNGLETVYAHLHERYVEEGNIVALGEEIGTVGNTGRSSGAHLHFEVHAGKWDIEKSNSIDPMLVLADEPNSYIVVDEPTDEELRTVLSQRSSVTSENGKKEGQIETSVVVSKGDTLWHIAKEHGVTVDEIKNWNDLPSDKIIKGQALKLFSKEEHIHIVQSGETLTAISYVYDVPVSKIKTLNGLSNDVIYPGHALKVKD
ncbi:peptidoglycan DD-metalloendopeptidase family protein [Bacillus alkalicellulosilyticus]|uniref:peptidoglycan DD-metalloendopeptidase family protein n=1 Tax=Alkalihalobacterium alkalicellulosilyticum TaxID=1912214 RepID=UPI0009983B64|nr:peptidoglycan DD-metalloendopeptidase family protein [Bacillus alkalicellulosilyticus]